MLHERFIGTLVLTRYGACVLADRKKISEDIAIPPRYLHGADDGDKVVVEILREATRRQPPTGKIVKILGREGDNETEMHAILAEFGLPDEYPTDAIKEAEEIEDDISSQEVWRRRDMRDTLTFTIDPADAKDFDDALSFRRLDDTTCEVGVHIADVTHYIPHGSLLDAEAYNRATSVYLVDRTIPMLPERLCNQLCSLRQDEDKLTMSVIFTLDTKAHVLKQKICRTIIRSAARLNYEQAQTMLDEAAAQTDRTPLYEALYTLNELAKQLREERFRHGSINFEREEVKVLVDEQGKPVGFAMEEVTDSHHLIEEFMLLANRTVATELNRINREAVYRVHDVPDPDKIDALSTFVHKFGYDMRLPKRHTRDEHPAATATKAIKTLLEQTEGTPEEELIHTLAVRAMPKAVYSTHNIGHYGLSFPYYTHFTSPIRRYPDMMVHRLVAKYILNSKQPAANGQQTTFTDLEEACKHCSEREQMAVAAERASVKYKQAEWIQMHLNETFKGIVSGVTEYGAYVQLNDSHCEGLVHMRDLGDDRNEDYWTYSEQDYCLTNERTGERIVLGDTISVRVLRADALRRQIDFARVIE